jgi:hypothetical protein
MDRDTWRHRLYPASLRQQVPGPGARPGRLRIAAELMGKPSAERPDSECHMQQGRSEAGGFGRAASAVPHTNRIGLRHDVDFHQM